MTRRRRRASPHSNHERWLVSYADFITLLFAFFVVLYASSQVDHKKVGKLALAIQVAFQDMGAFPAAGVPPPIELGDPVPFNNVHAIQNLQRVVAPAPMVSPPSESLTNASDETELATLQDELQQALRDEIVLHEVSLHRERDGLVVSLQEFGFFSSGSAALKPGSLNAFDRIASILAIRACRLRIEGHTDNIPIHTAQIASNWELSTARATELIRILILDHRFSPERLSAAGYAEYHPVANNLTPTGRAQNRRVDIVILGSSSAPQ